MPNNKRNHILLVDDDKIIRKMVGSMLTALGYDVIAVKDGHEAIAAFNVNGFDVVLTDINMPHMDGWQLAIRLKDIKPDIPIIAITGEDPNNILARLPGSQIIRALFKPFNMIVLRDTLNEFTR